MSKKLLKIFSIMLVFMMILLTFSGCSNKNSSNSEDSSEKVVNLFTWANYVPDDVVKQF